VITDKYAYDPFGAIANRAGNTENPFTFVGQYGLMDEGNGLCYVRARYYDSRIGRFLNKDLILGDDTDPRTLHRYVYVQNNPVGLVDVSGLLKVYSGYLDIDTKIAGSTPMFDLTNSENESKAGMQVFKSFWKALLHVGAGSTYLFIAGEEWALATMDPTGKFRILSASHSISGLNQLNEASINFYLVFENAYRAMLGRDALEELNSEEGIYGYMMPLFEINTAISIGGGFPE